jgi:hypothetical protein
VHGQRSCWRSFKKKSRYIPDFTLSSQICLGGNVQWSVEFMLIGMQCSTLPLVLASINLTLRSLLIHKDFPPLSIL